MIKFSFDYDDLSDTSIIPTEAYQFYREGVIYRKNHIYDKAISCFNKAVYIKPSFYNAYLQKFFTLCELEEINSTVNCEVIACINKAIKFCPSAKVSYLHSIKAEYYMAQKKYNKAAYAYKESILACSSNIPIILNLIKCLKILWDIPQILKYYEIALSNVREYEVNLTRDANDLFLQRETKLCPSSIITKRIEGKQPQVCEITYPYADVCYEYSTFLNSLGLYSKAYYLAGKAIAHSHWSQYIVHRIDICVKMPSKLRTKNIIKNFQIDYTNRKKIGGEIFENKNLYLYNCLKNSSNSLEKNFDINIAPLIFRGNPLSLLQWAILHKQEHALSYLISENMCEMPEITPFLDYQQYCVLEYDKRTSLFITGLLNYYLGGIASSFMLFDDEFELCFDNLTSRESYFYSKIAKEMGIDFVEIHTFAINHVRDNIQTDEDLFFLGMMYLLNKDKGHAIECFFQSKSYKFSRFMLFALENIVEYKSEVEILRKYHVAQSFNLETGLDQLIDYFITVECASFYNLYFYSDYYSQICSTILPLWDVFMFSSDLIKIITSEISQLCLKEDLLKVISDNCSELYNNNLSANSIGTRGICYYLSIEDLLSAIQLQKIDKFNVFENTLLLYKNSKLSIDEMLSINLYSYFIDNQKRTSNLIKTVLYTGCMATSYLNIFVGTILSSIFYYLDSSGLFNANQLDYNSFSNNVMMGSQSSPVCIKMFHRFINKLSIQR